MLAAGAAVFQVDSHDLANCVVAISDLRVVAGVAQQAALVASIESIIKRYPNLGIYQTVLAAVGTVC
eukprot:SAG31_NODE_8877_length_1369_cov_1.154331_1_plen_66_part_10